jgi:hypothetical protein
MMETNCERCHQTVTDGSRYCPVCGLPQIVYSGENGGSPDQPEDGREPVRDAGSVHWKAALRTVLTLAIPAGILCSMLSPIGILGLMLMGLAGTWSVILYMRKDKPAWITIGAGARIGLVTGVLGGWVAAATSGLTLYVLRFWLHKGSLFDDFWQNMVSGQMTQQWKSMGVDAQTIAEARSWLLAPEGRGGWVLGAIGLLIAAELGIAMAGGALAARMAAHSRRTTL